MNEYIFSVTDRDGRVTFVRVRAADPNTAQSILLRRYGSRAQQTQPRGLASEYSRDQLAEMDEIGDGSGGGGSDGSGGGGSDGRGGGGSDGRGLSLGVTGGLENLGGAGQSAAFARALGTQGQNTEGLFGQYLRNLERPFAGTFTVQTALGQQTDRSEDAFQKAAARTPVGDIRRQATQAFRDLLNLQGPQRNAGDEAMLAGYRDPFGLKTDSEGKVSYDEQTVDNVTALAQQAAQSRWSPFVANALLPDAATIKRRYTASGPSADNPYMAFLRKQLGIEGNF